MTDGELLSAVRFIIREEIHGALNDFFATIQPSTALIDKFNISEGLPITIKERSQNLEKWSGSLKERIAAAEERRAHLDLLAEKRNKLKAEGKWPPSKKKKS